MLERGKIHLISNHRHVEKRCRKQFTWENAGLMNVQPARPRENYGGAGVDADGLVALAVEIREPPRKRFENTLDAARIIFPRIGSRVFEIEHDPRGARIQHFHYEIRVIGGTSHLITLI